jgi:hypothetical protein
MVPQRLALLPVTRLASFLFLLTAAFVATAPLAQAQPGARNKAQARAASRAPAPASVQWLARGSATFSPTS